VSEVQRSSRRAAAVILAAALPFLAWPRAVPAADPEAGRQKAQACAACHGPGGNSVIPSTPSLSGQPTQFIVTQLIMFREGNRKDPQMSPMAKDLTNADVNNLAAYYFAQPVTPLAHATAADKAAAGRRLTEQNHCVDCHSPTLRGQQHIPRLAGQQFEYLRTQLRGFKAGTRFDMDGQMSSVAQPIPDADIEILADYLAGMK
jgi:cytochrome c553